MTMAAGEEGWVHSFSINDVSRHKKGYTIYKITSIIFPRYVPEALSCVTVWKRFSEIKTLYREIHRKHRALKLSGKLPKLEDSYFFRRFDTEVISERRQYILDLLEFISIHPALYTSEVFVKFLRGGHTPNVSPNHKRGNIAEICKDLSIPFQSEIALIDPTRDSEAESDILPFDCVDSISTVSVDTLGNGGSDLSRRDSVVSDEGSIGSLAREPSVASNHQLSLQLSISQDIDYFFDAAVEFSRAMQAEVNGKYQESFESYKKGIDTLLVGAKQDNDVERQQMAKEKATKYLKRAESICENHIVKKPHPFSPTETQPYSLERPLAHLSRYKVIQIVETVMQVQDTTDKKIYIMKAIEKPPSSYLFLGAFLPHKIPYMVPLVAYFQSESSIYLLLHQAPGGKLYDYIRNFTPGEYQDIPEIPTEEELDEKPEEESSGEEAIKNAPETSAEDTEAEESASEEGATYRPPSFEILSKDMDVLDLVHCAKSLLKSVSSTLRQSKGIGNEVDDIALPPVLQNIPEELENLPEDEENLFEGIEKLPDVEKKSPEVAENSIKGMENQNKETENQNKEAENPPQETKDLNLNEFNDSSSETDKDPRKDPQKDFAERPKTPKKHPIPEGCVRQWARELVIAVDALHRHNVICCDLHPDNLLLGSGGQLLLTYFYCRPNATERFLRQDAMDGGYVAPERPLTEVSDWWTVGVILYEILTQTTFTVLHPGEMFNYYEVQYPEVEISDEARALIDGLLQVNPSERFGIDEILTHAFFRNTDWEAVRSMGNHS